MENIEVFNNQELDLKVRAIQNEDGSISINAEDTARGFGWTTVARSGNEVVRWARMNGYCEEFGFPNKLGKDDYIPESLFYRLGMKANNAVADKFQNWLAMEVIPTIRKTGGYVHNDKLFVGTYLPFADDNTKALFEQTLETIRKQNALIKQQQEEIQHKQEIINGFTEDIDIYKKKDIINRVCRRRTGYASRYKELYRSFKETSHIDLEARCEGYNIKQAKRSDKLSVIKYAEKFGFIDDLYTCCTKLYETEVNELIESLKAVHGITND